MTSLVDRERLRQQLVRHEALRKKPYLDAKGFLTIGVGRNLETVGLSVDECHYLLSNDIDSAVRALVAYAWFPSLDPVRQAALTNVMFNLGPRSFASFKRMIAALERRDYETAGDELLASQYAIDVGSRAEELSAQLRSGRWQ